MRNKMVVGVVAGAALATMTLFGLAKAEEPPPMCGTIACPVVGVTVFPTLPPPIPPPAICPPDGGICAPSLYPLYLPLIQG